MTGFRIALIAGFAALTASTALAQQGTESPETITGGSADVIVGGKPAVRAGDSSTTGNVVTGGSANVFINGRPAATAGETTSCGGLAVGGNATVIVNGKPLAGSGESTVDCAGD